MLELQQAHLYVLRNCDEVQPFIRYCCCYVILILTHSFIFTYSYYYLYMLNCSEYNNRQEGSELQPFTPSGNQNFIMWFKDKVHDNVFVLKTEGV